MNKQEINEKLKENGAWCTECHTGVTDRYVKIRKAMELVGQLDEPKKLVVPKFVAEWFEEKEGGLENAIFYECVRMTEAYSKDYSEFQRWFVSSENNPIETLVRMKDGYEVEEEQKWVVKSNKLYFTGITQLTARDPITYNFTTDENLAHVFDDKESAEKEASFFDGAVEKV